MQVKKVRSPLTLKADGAEGDVSAIVSTFNVVDSDGDVVLASAFTDGQAVPMVWSHNWDMPVGKGTIRVEPTRAVFDGRFFTETTAGRDAYQTVRAMADLQEFSWGFRILAAEPGTLENRAVRFIKSTEVFEVSPVLVGANRETGLLAIKAETPALKYGGMGGEPPVGSYEALSEDIEEAVEALLLPPGSDGWVCVIATYPTHAVAYVQRMGQDDVYLDYPYVVGGDGETITLGAPTPVEAETTFTPVKGDGMPYGLHAARVESAVQGLIERTKAGSALRSSSKEGRPMTEARRTRVAAIRDGLRTHADELHALWEETAPKEPPKSDPASGRRLFAQFLQTTARLNGVAV